jgi:hypothetical protein
MMAAWPPLLETVHWSVRQNVEYNECTASSCQSLAHRAA